MRNPYLVERSLAIATAAVLLAGCQQTDSPNPFEVDETETALSTIGPSGGVVGMPPRVSMDFPAGAFPGAVSVAISRLVDRPFPDRSGTAVPGTAFEVDVPAGTLLEAPARVELAVDPAMLSPGHDVRLAVAVHAEDGSVPTFPGTYDVANGLLRADIDALGDLAAVIAADAIPVAGNGPPALVGGKVPPPPSAAAVGPAVAGWDGSAFHLECSAAMQSCQTQGSIQLWADDVVRERLGNALVLLNPRIEASVDFLSFDEHDVPMEIVGSISVGGELRARLNSVVTGYAFEEGLWTGASEEPAPTALDMTGNTLVMSQVTLPGGEVVFDESVQFDVTGTGPAAVLRLRLETEFDFANGDGTYTTGKVVAHLRLRR